MNRLRSDLTYAIDKPECKIQQNLNKDETRISFFDESCVTKTNDVTDPGFTLYSLSLKVTNKNIVVTGPEKLTFKCKVKNVQEIDLPNITLPGPVVIDSSNQFDCLSLPCIYTIRNQSSNNENPSIDDTM